MSSYLHSLKIQENKNKRIISFLYKKKGNRISSWIPRQKLLWHAQRPDTVIYRGLTKQ